MNDEKDFAPSDRRRRTLAVPVGLGVLVLLSATAFGISTQIKSPAQTAASAKPPALSAITAAVTMQVLSRDVVFRGNVLAASSLTVAAPSLPTGSSPVVTALNAKPGDTVHAGEVVAAVAGRPIIVLQGKIAAYRQMVVGDSGIDVSQLQEGLHELGYSTGGDVPGTYGVGTAIAVSALYASKGYQPIDASPDAGNNVSPSLSAALSSGKIAQQSSLSETTTTTTIPVLATTTSTTSSSVSPTTTVTTTSISPAPSTVSPNTTTTTTTTMPAEAASVPLGEIVFVSALPALVQSSAAVLGQELSSSSSAGSGGSSADSTGSALPIFSLGTSGVQVNGQVDVSDAQALRSGMPATLNDDANGGNWSGTVATVTVAQASQSTPGNSTTDTGAGPPQATVVVVPAAQASVPLTEIGENIRVTVTTANSNGAVLAVPIAAVFARSDGRSYVTVVNGKMKRSVPVITGLDARGEIEVTPVDQSLTVGDEVLVGSG